MWVFRPTHNLVSRKYRGIGKRGLESLKGVWWLNQFSMSELTARFRGQRKVNSVGQRRASKFYVKRFAYVRDDFKSIVYFTFEMRNYRTYRNTLCSLICWYMFHCGQTSCIQAAEMRFLRHMARYTLHDHRRNTDIRQDLNIMSILDRIAQYRLLSLIHI